jgi:hypothetical protein
MDAALLLSPEYLHSIASCSFHALEESLDTSLLAGSSKWPPNVYSCSIGDRKLA